jgi:hypothetical protein
MVRLASFDPPDLKDPASTIEQMHGALQELQREFAEEVAPALAASGVQADMEPAFFQLDRLAKTYDRFVGWLHWEHSRNYDVEPTVANAIYVVEQQARDVAEWRTWSRLFRDAALGLMEAADDYQAIEAQRAAEKLIKKLDKLEPDLAECENLQQRVLRLYRSVPGMHCILLGMRARSYVMDALHAEKQPKIEGAEAVLAMFNNPPTR